MTFDELKAEYAALCDESKPMHTAFREFSERALAIKADMVGTLTLGMPIVDKACEVVILDLADSRVTPQALVDSFKRLREKNRVPQRITQVNNTYFLFFA